ncbi:unnamed protein product [Alopecurus aequalis]
MSQLTNQTDGFVAFHVITNQAKYSTQPTKGIMAPCSKRYISVTLRVEGEAPPNMQCNDMLLVQSSRVNEGHTSEGNAVDEAIAEERQWTSSNSNVLAVDDPAIELRFLSEPRKDISTCVQLTNQTDGFVAFRVITDQAKYSTQPTKGIMAPCTKRYISVTLRAQDETPLNMRGDDMFLVQSAPVSKDRASDGIVEEEVMAGEAVGMVRLPIVYVGSDQVRR